MVTPPVEVITTTITTCACSSSTSTRRISVVSSGGAVTSASSEVTCDSISVVVRSAVSISERVALRSTGKLRRAQRLLQQQVGIQPVAGVGRNPARGRVRMVRAGPRDSSSASS